MDGGLAARQLHHIGLAFIFHHRVQHGFNFVQWIVNVFVGAAGGKTHGAIEVASLVDFDDGKARMLHVVGAEAAIIRAAIMHGRVKGLGHFRPLHKHLAPQAVIGFIVTDEHPLGAVLWAPFVHVHLAFFEQNLCFDLSKTGGANAASGVIKMVRAVFARHRKRPVNNYLEVWRGLWRYSQ